jgi:hypothetical protein
MEAFGPQAAPQNRVISAKPSLPDFAFMAGCAAADLEDR